MRGKTRDLILEKFLDQLKGLIKGLLERLMLEERELYLQEHPTKAIGPRGVHHPKSSGAWPDGLRRCKVSTPFRNWTHREVSERPYGQGVGGIGAPSSQAQEAWEAEEIPTTGDPQMGSFMC